MALRPCAGADLQEPRILLAGRQSADQVLDLGQRRSGLQIVVGRSNAEILLDIAGNEVRIDVALLELDGQVVLEMNQDEAEMIATMIAAVVN